MQTRSPLPALIAQLREDHETLRAAVQRVPAELRGLRPSPERWSVAEVVEHLAIIEPRVVGLMTNLINTAPVLAPDDQPTEPLDFDRSVLNDRSRTISAPAPLLPKGSLDAASALASLEASRASLHALLESAHDRDLGAVSQTHLWFGSLNGFQWLSAHAGHEARHAAQIAEVGEAVATSRTGEAFEGDIQLTVLGRKLRAGEPAPAFSLDALAPGEAVPREITLSGGAGRVRLLHVVNSLDTPVCHVGAHRFETLRSSGLPADVDVHTVSMDLPFAQARWREVEKVNHEALSSHRSEAFGQAYGVLLREWRILQRAVFVIDGSGTIVHAEYVSDQMVEPDYATAVAAARSASRAT